MTVEGGKAYPRWTWCVGGDGGDGGYGRMAQPTNPNPALKAVLLAHRFLENIP